MHEEGDDRENGDEDGKNGDERRCSMLRVAWSRATTVEVKKKELKLC